MKHETVNLPADYKRIIQDARKGVPGKYGVEYVYFPFFKDFKECCDIDTIKPSVAVGPPYVTNIRQFDYSPDGSIKVNLTFDDSKWQDIPYNITLTNRTPKQMYSEELKISYSKYSDLQDIKETIEKEYHSFYDNLKHKTRPIKVIKSAD